MTTAYSHPSAVKQGEHGEGELTKQIEHYTSQVPSGEYLSLAAGAIGLSAALHLIGRKAELSVRRALGADHPSARPVQ